MVYMNNQFTDAKPVGTYTKKELIDLEHKYRLLLKKDGFEDIEMWDNKPKQKRKRIKFIKGHIRWSHYINNGTSFAKKFEMNEQYFNIIGLYANHSSDVPEKYRAALIEYAITGNLVKAVQNVDNGTNYKSIHSYIHKNLPTMIEFVNDEFKYD